MYQFVTTATPAQQLAAHMANEPAKKLATKKVTFFVPAIEWRGADFHDFGQEYAFDLHVASIPDCYRILTAWAEEAEEAGEPTDASVYRRASALLGQYGSQQHFDALPFDGEKVNPEWIHWESIRRALVSYGHTGGVTLPTSDGGWMHQLFDPADFDCTVEEAAEK